ncbi:MAG: SUMF1/EgtB/PvdO family nonheme iron enzyme [Polyangiaceae bacterium]
MKLGRARSALCCSLLALSCSRSPERSDHERPSSSATPLVADATPAPEAPALLYLPDGGDVAQTGVAPALLPGMPPALARCPAEMVDIRGRYCIDRYEVTLVDEKQGRRLSPYYHPTRAQTAASLKEWTAYARGQTLAVPSPPDFQLAEDFEPRAESRAGVTPNGYLSGNLAAVACRNAGKRLCTIDEWVFACRGEAARKFPYGDHYEEGVCNVFREAHPGQILHGDMSIGHLDPRLNLVVGPAGPLLRKTGATTTCRSTWGNDAVYDMVGNLDEWVDADRGAFLGGFYSRSTREGCDSKVSSHPRAYFDYSLGTRCCR